MMDKIARMSEKHPFALVGVIVLITVVMLAGIPKISSEVEMRALLPEDYPSVRATLEMEDKFGEMRYEFILIKSENVTNADAVKSLLNLQQKLTTEPTLENYVIQVESYLDYLNLKMIDNQVYILENSQWQPLPDNQLESRIQSFLVQPENYVLTVGRYITSDQKKCLLGVRINPDLKPSEVVEKTRFFEDFIKSYIFESDFNVSITGEYSVSKDITDVVDKERWILLIAVAILITVVLALALRCFSDVALPFIVVGLSVVWVTGIMGHFGILFSTVAFAIPPILFGVCISYALHMIYRYREERSKGYHANEAAISSVKTAGKAVFLTAATTAAGFGSWLVLDIPPLRDFGFLCMLGVLLSFFFVVTLLPAFWIIRDRKKGTRKPVRVKARGVTKAKSALNQAGVKIVRGVERHPRKVAIAIGALTVLAAIFATQTSTAIQLEEFAPTEVESAKTFSEVKEYFPKQDSSRFCMVLVKGDVTDPATLGAMIELRQRVLSDPRNFENKIIWSLNIADYVLWMNDWSLPENSDHVKAILENSPHPQIRMMITPDNRATIIIFYGAPKTDADLKLMADIIRDHAEQVNQNTQAEFDVGGMPTIVADLLSEIPQSALKTILVTFTLIALFLCLVFRSLKFGLITLAPICLALVWEFGAFYAFDIPLNLITMLISSLLIGIGIDFSVHLTHRFREEWRDHLREPRESMCTSVLQVGKPISVATAITCGAFGILILSRIPAMGTFGGVTALMILFCMLATLFVLPPMLVAFSKRESGAER